MLKKGDLVEIIPRSQVPDPKEGPGYTTDMDTQYSGMTCRIRKILPQYVPTWILLEDLVGKPMGFSWIAAWLKLVQGTSCPFKKGDKVIPIPREQIDPALRTGYTKAMVDTYRSKPMTIREIQRSTTLPSGWVIYMVDNGYYWEPTWLQALVTSSLEAMGCAACGGQEHIPTYQYVKLTTVPHYLCSGCMEKFGRWYFGR